MSDNQTTWFDLRIRLFDNYGVVCDQNAISIADLNIKVHAALQELSSLETIAFSGLVEEDKIRQTIALAVSYSTIQTLSICSIQLVICGSRGIASSVAQILGNHQLFLQRPHDLYSSFPYENPQYFDLPECSDSVMTSPLSEEENADPMQQMDGQEQFQNAETSEMDDDPLDVLQELFTPQGIRAIDVDSKIRTALFR